MSGILYNVLAGAEMSRLHLEYSLLHCFWSKFIENGYGLMGHTDAMYLERPCWYSQKDQITIEYIQREKEGERENWFDSKGPKQKMSFYMLGISLLIDNGYKLAIYGSEKVISVMCFIHQEL